MVNFGPFSNRLKMVNNPYKLGHFQWKGMGHWPCLGDFWPCLSLTMFALPLKCGHFSNFKLFFHLTYPYEKNSYILVALIETYPNLAFVLNTFIKLKRYPGQNKTYNVCTIWRYISLTLALIVTRIRPVLWFLFYLYCVFCLVSSFKALELNLRLN